MNLRLFRVYCLVLALMITDDNLFDNEFRFYWIMALIAISLSDDILYKINKTKIK